MGEVISEAFKESFKQAAKILFVDDAISDAKLKNELMYPLPPDDVIVALMSKEGYRRTNWIWEYCGEVPDTYEDVQRDIAVCLSEKNEYSQSEVVSLLGYVPKHKQILKLALEQSGFTRRGESWKRNIPIERKIVITDYSPVSEMHKAFDAYIGKNHKSITVEEIRKEIGVDLNAKHIYREMWRLGYCQAQVGVYIRNE